MSKLLQRLLTYNMSAGEPPAYPPSSLLLPLSSVYQLLPLLFGNNGKEARHHAAVVPGYRVKEPTRPAGTMVTVLHLKRSRKRAIMPKHTSTEISGQLQKLLANN